MGDNLDDEYDFDFVGTSSSANDDSSPLESSSSNHTIFAEDIEDAELDSSKKRKNASTSSAAVPTIPPPKKKQKKKQKPTVSMTNAQLLIETGRTIASTPLPTQVAFLKTIMTLFPEAEAEAEADVVAASSLLTSSLTSSLLTNHPSFKAAHNDPNLELFLKLTWPCESTQSSKMKQLKKYSKPNKPHYTIISSSALRCMSLLKSISSLKLRCIKLFGKNIDTSAQIAQLRGGECSIAVGTPGRLSKLLTLEENDAGLKFDANSVIIIDCSPDVKGFNSMTLRDCQRDLVTVMREAIGVGAKIALY